MPSLSETKPAGGPVGKQYWRSLESLADAPEVRRHLEREFPYLYDAAIPSATRRSFLKLMGASLALGGLAGCRWPKENIVEWAKRPTGRQPGKPVFYATTLDVGGAGIGLLVKTYDGRPIKIEGNPDHPASLGGTDALAQAMILEMYDPDRSQTAIHRSGGASKTTTYPEFAAFAATHFAGLKNQRGAGLAFLCGASSSPTLAEQRDAVLKAYPEAKWYEYEPLSRDNARQGTQIAFNKPMRQQVDFSKADVIVSLDEDFLMTHPAAVRNMREFARRRTSEGGQMNRLYMLEANYSLTGTNADHRFAERVADLPIRLAQLAAELLKQGLQLSPGASSAADKLKGFDAGAMQPPYLASIAKDLLEHKGKSVILCGPRLPAEAHALACALNEALGALGATIGYTEVDDGQRPSHLEAVAALAADASAGKIDTLVILSGNPVYDAPADLDMAAALDKIKNSIHLSLHNDETSQKCTWHVPLAHFLESWGDARAWDGTYSIVQPLIEPLYAGVTAIEFLGLIRDPAKTAPTGYELVRETFKARFAGAGDFESAWRKALHDGLVEKTAWPKNATPLTRNEWGKVLDALNNPVANKGDAFEVVFTADYKVYDGRFANNAWLQELPDPLTKITWDNAALVSPADAKRLGLRTTNYGDKLAITVGGRKIEIAAFVLPGHAKGSITLPLGYGRKAAGKIADESGVNVTALRSKSGFHVATGATVSKLGLSHQLTTTQDHHTIQSDIGSREMEERVPRELIRSATQAEYKENPHFARHEGHALPQLQLFNGADYAKEGVHRWGMAIDLTKCTGCHACVVACQAENNIPVVGREEVDRGREMHWLRIDRYFNGEPDAPQVVHQPMPCQHCENAPCEQVCPVAATTHDEDGLNVMVYNRCVGTRYCSNNCPYKVRRFNWFYNHHGPRHPRSNGVMAQTNITPIEMMGHNPDVTVRSRGVMEKCTFCVQRINAAKIAHRNEALTPSLNSPGAAIPDGEVMPACAQVCPAEAIIFGDLNLKDSKVAKAHAHDRAYPILDEFNTRPRNQYLAKLTNPGAVAAGPARHGEVQASAAQRTTEQVV